MDAPRSVDKITVYNKPFFVNELLNLVQPNSITPQLFGQLIKESHSFDLANILTAMTRQVDYSGLVPNLAGVYSNPQDVMEVLVNIGHRQLLEIAQLEPELQTEVFDTIKGDPETSMRALLVLDECQRSVVAQLGQIRQGSPFALALRQAAEDAVKNLNRDPQSLHTPMFDDIIQYEDRVILYSGEPHICYPKRVFNGAVVEVWQYFFMPRLTDTCLSMPYTRFTVEEILKEVTPKIFRRGFTDDSKFDPRTPLGFIGLLGKVGGAVPRLIAMQIRKNEQIRKQVMHDEEVATALYTLFSR